MTKKKHSDTLDLARAKILRVANAAVNPNSTRILTMRHLNQAVCIVRRRSLVEDHVLAEAGFNPKGGR